MKLRMRNTSFLRNSLLWVVLGIALAGVTGCASDIQTVQFKINSEPEGAHVAMQVSGPEHVRSTDWIYLGHTPIRIVRQFDEDAVANAKITMKVMHAGYYDQVREWEGETFLNEAVKSGVLFWTPELVPHPSGQ